MPCLILKTRRKTCSQPKTPRFQIIFGKVNAVVLFYYKRAFFIKALKYRRFGNDIVQSVSVVFYGAFRWLFFYNQKSFVRRRVRRCRLRHKIHANKTRPNNSLRFLQRKNSIRRYLTNDLTFSSFAKRRSEQENVFTTNNTRPNQKINRLNQTALFLTQGLTTAALQCTVRPQFFFFRTKSQPFNKKPKQNYIKQSQQTIQNLSNNNTPKDKHNKQLRKNAMFLNIKIIAD